MNININKKQNLNNEAKDLYTNNYRTLLIKMKGQ